MFMLASLFHVEAQTEQKKLEKMLKEMQWRQFQDYLQGKGSGN